MQNELLKVMALSVLRSIADTIRHADFFTIMVDECADISNQEQVYVHCIKLDR